MDIERINRLHEGPTLADMAEAPRERLGTGGRVLLWACICVSVASMGYLIGAVLRAALGGV